MPTYRTGTSISDAEWSEWTTTSTASTWGCWVDGTTSVTSVTNCTVASSTAAWTTWTGEYQGDELTAEESAAWEQRRVEFREQETVRQQQAREAHEQRIRNAKAGEERATKLLRDALDKKQRNRFDNHGHFFVRGPSGRLYRVDPGRVGNVRVMDGDKIDHSLCCHVRENVPNHDNMLAQKVMLEHFETEFLSMANRH